jgi:hypothetical protein
MMIKIKSIYKKIQDHGVAIIKKISLLFFTALLIIPSYSTLYLYSDSFLWLTTPTNKKESLKLRISPPEGYERIPVQSGSFAHWLRNLPLKPGKPPVFLYDGTKKGNQSIHWAVINIDTGEEDLQQCADAIIRLRAEYLYEIKKYTEIHFNFTSGDTAAFTKWANGYRPIIKNNKVTWKKSGNIDNSYKNFRKYLHKVFIYAGTYSLRREMKRRPLKDMQIGDLFIEEGFPGHAVFIVDMAINKESGEKIFLLAQSYMPAQDIHILINPNNQNLSPWYELAFNGELITPEWIFKKSDLHSF